MIFVRPLTDDERRTLQRLARSEIGRVSERMHMVLLSGRGYPVPQIAAIFDCDEATVRTWLGRFEAEGVDGLHDRPRAQTRLNLGEHRARPTPAPVTRSARRSRSPPPRAGTSPGTGPWRCWPPTWRPRTGLP